MSVIAGHILIGAVCLGGAIGGIIQIYRREKDARLWRAKQEHDEAMFRLANPGKPVPPRNQLV